MRMSRVAGIGIGFALTLSLSPPLTLHAQAPPPAAWNFQGRLTDASGVPISTAQNMVFTFYDAPASGTTLLSESQAAVPVVNGIYNVKLGTGTVTPGTEPAYPAMFGNNSVVFLGVAVATDAEMTPRIQIVSTPYATNAATLDGRPAAAFMLASGTSAGPFSISESVASPSLLVNDTGGGPLLQLQNTGADKFVVSGGGDVTASGFMNLVGLASSPASATAGEGRMYYDSTLNRLRISGSGTPYADVALDPMVVHRGPAAADVDATPNHSIWVNETGGGGNLLRLEKTGAARFVVYPSGQMAVYDDAAGPSIYAQDNAGGGPLLQLQDASAVDQFVVSNTGDVTVAGNVGINTSPAAGNRLHIVGTTANEHVLFESSVSNGNPFIIVKANNPAGEAGFTADRADTGAGAGLRLATGGAQDWQFHTEPARYDLSLFNNVGTEVMTVKQTGNVGIGTTAPNSALAVNGPISTKVTTAGTNYTILDTDSVVVKTGAAAVTFTLPDAAGRTGRRYCIFNNGSAGSITVAATGPSTVVGVTNITTANPRGATYISDGTDWLGY